MYMHIYIYIYLYIYIYIYTHEAVAQYRDASQSGKGLSTCPHMLLL